MPSASRAMAGGAAQVQAYGQKDALNQENTWAAGDQWSAPIASTAGNAVLGVGNLLGQNLTSLFVYRDRVYAANTGQFNFSDNGDPTGWEVQNSGAGEVSYTTSFGSEDIVEAFSQLQGRVAIFGRRSVQLWTTDADPNNFSWIQTLDNSGTAAPLSVINLGDYDVIYLDDSGVRSLRAKEVTSNAFIDDIGSAIDDLIQTQLSPAGSSADAIRVLACGIVEPATKNYWLAIPQGVFGIGSTMYILSRHPAVKQTAWSTYTPSWKKVISPDSATYDGSGNVTYVGKLTVGHTYNWIKGSSSDVSFTCGSTTLTSTGSFVATSVDGSGVGIIGHAVTSTLVDMTALPLNPSKFVVYKGLIYVLGSDTDGVKIWQYGGPNGNQYDGTVCSFQLPWLDDKRPDSNKKAQGIQFVISGQWTISVGMDPKSGLTQIVQQGSPTSPNSLNDSTYDQGRFGVAMAGTHFSASGVSNNVYGLTMPAVFSALSFYYNHAEIK